MLSNLLNGTDFLNEPLTTVTESDIAGGRKAGEDRTW